MKQLSFLHVGLLVVLMVTMVSCGLPKEITSEYYEEVPARRNIYYGDPYYSGLNTIILERDPFTGRYYQVGPGLYNGIYGTPIYPYNSRRYNLDRHYNNRTNTSRRNGYYQTFPQKQLQQTPAQREQIRREREQAKETILGKKRD